VWLSFIEDLKKRIIYLDLQNKTWYNIYERLGKRYEIYFKKSVW
jgi:hypothetical protein